MADVDEIQYLEYSEESPFVRAAVEEEKKKKEEEEKEEEERAVGRKKRKYKLDENSVSLGWRIYAIAIITLLNALNFTQQYLPIVTISGMANDVEFGETECRVINETLAGEYLRDFNLTGDPEELCSEMGRCSENSTLFLPDVCQLQYTGRGTLYEILAGPSNLIIQGVLSIPLLGFFQRFSFRPPFVIGLFSMLWTLCTFITAYVHDYWAIVFLRILFGVFSGPYIPVVFAYLATICPKRVHAVVFGIAHYACVAGYGIAYLFILVSDSIGWRWCYFICGATGVVVAIGSCLMINPKVLYPLGQSCQSRTLRPSWKQQRAGLRQIVWSLMLSVILSNTARIASFCVFSFNITFYLVEYFPDFNVVFLSWVTLVSSCTGCIFGGLLSDQLRKTAGVRGRLWLTLILMIIALVSSPFIFQTQVTIAVTLVGIYLAVSDWFYVVNLAVISDLTPLECKTIIFALNFFFTYSVGGAANLAVAPLTSLISLRTALTILCGLLSGLAVILQLISLGVIECLKEIFRNLTERTDPSREEGETEADETTPLTMSYRSFDSNTIATTVTIENPT